MGSLRRSILGGAALLLLGVVQAQSTHAAWALISDDRLRALPPSGSFSLQQPLPSVDLLHMPSPYAYERLGLFCKAEVKMDRWLPIPLMVRLGDVERAEELDGKGVYRALYAH